MQPTESLELSRLHARADVALRSARWPDAAEALRALLALRPDDADAWYNLAYALQQLNQVLDALQAYRHAIDSGLDAVEQAHLNRAALLAEALRRPGQAKAELHAALKARPDMVAAWLNLGNLHEQEGDREQARASYQRVLELAPDQALALARLAGLQTPDDPEPGLTARLRRAVERAPSDPATRADLGFGLGRLLDALGDYDDAFAAYEQANRDSARVAAAGGFRYAPEQHEEHVRRLMRLFEQAPGADASSPAIEAPGEDAPIFICGMFRSGSTLVEQILASHPAVHSMGELDLLPQIAADSLRPFLRQAARGLTKDVVRQARQAYLGALGQRSATSLRLTDKRPDNILFVGLIKAMFPQARIVFTERAALDNCLSVYFLHLSHQMAYATDLGSTAHWFGQTHRLMQHWQQLYGAGLHTVNYDALIGSPREHIAALLNYCGLPWHEGCLRFHEAPTLVMTPSAWQVRQPLYQRASGRWRNYEKHLGPLRAALAASLPPGAEHLLRATG